MLKRDKNIQSLIYLILRFCNIFVVNILVVCLEKDRDGLRTKLLSWIEAIEVGFENEGASHRDILMSLFQVLDENNDTQISTMEFVKLLEGNKSVSEVDLTLFSAKPRCFSLFSWANALGLYKASTLCLIFAVSAVIEFGSY